MSKLENVKHEKACQNRAKGMGKGESYINAGYNVTLEVACAAMNRLLKNVKVSERIEELRKENQVMLGIERNDLLAYLRNMLKANLVEMTQTELDKLPIEIQLCINKIEVTGEGENKKYKLWICDKQKAVEIINKMCGNNAAEQFQGVIETKHSGLKEEAKEKGFEDIRDYLQSVMNKDNDAAE